MKLSTFTRRRYTAGWTPIEKLARFSEAIGGPTIYIKRDDLLGLTAGGNKTRKLEFLVADALSQGADTLITCGAVQSNHCRLTLAAAVKEGLKCRLILSEAVPGSYRQDANGNVFLYHLLGAEKIQVVPWGSDLTAELAKAAAEVAAKGRKAYIIPMGGSNSIGAMGYIACAEEIMAQAFDTGLNIDHIIIAAGSAGTHAGLLLGIHGNHCNIPVTGISVLNPKPVYEKQLAELLAQTAARLGINATVPQEAIQCCDEYIGPGYGLPSAEMVEAVKLLAKTEAILLDPSYTGKDMAGLIGLAKSGYLKSGQNVLFIHTGGTPALFASIPAFIQS